MHVSKLERWLTQGSRRFNPLIHQSKKMNKRTPYFKVLFTVALLLTVGMLMAGCAASPHADETTADLYFTQSRADREIYERNQKLFASAGGQEDPADFLLGPGDLIQVNIFEAEELDTEVRVSSRGYVTLPMLGHVKVEDMTVREAEVMIEDRYRKSYIKDPHVSIFVKENYSQRVTVVGQVKNPGTYDYPTKQRLLDVLVLAGGLTEKAGRMAQVRKLDAARGDKQVILVDLRELIDEGQAILNVEINGGDVVFVPEAGMFFVDGAVRRPGSYPLRRQTTLIEAVQTAGGLLPWADEQEVFLLRFFENGEKKKLKINMAEFTGEEIYIQDRDLIVANASTWGKIKHGAGIWIGVPGFGGFTIRDPETR
jgi:polysaccharide export outer membrane protein